MTSEHELSAALKAQSSQIDLPAADVVAVANQGRRRRRRTAIVSGALVTVVLAGGLALVSTLLRSGDVAIDAARGPGTTANDVAITPDEGVEEPAVEEATEDTTEPPSAAGADRALRAIEILENEDGCGWSDGQRPAPTEALDMPSFHLMPDGTEIALVVCALAATQPADVRLFKVSGSDQLSGLAPVTVDNFGEAGVEQTTRLAGHVEIDADAGVLTVHTRFREAGGCGVTMQQRWAGGEIGRFVVETVAGVLECPTDESEGTDLVDWPQLYPPVDDQSDDQSTADEQPTDAGRVTDPVTKTLAVSDQCQAIARRASDIAADGAAMDCLQEALRGEYGSINQFWVEDVIDDGDRTLVVWRGSAFDGDFGAGSTWGFEDIHVTETTGWTDRVVRSLVWEDPSDIDWMYAYRIEFLAPSILRIMEGWHQGECYWVDHVDLTGAEVGFSTDLYRMPGPLEDLAADSSICQFDIDDEPMILATMFDAAEPLRYFGN